MKNLLNQTLLLLFLVGCIACQSSDIHSEQKEAQVSFEEQQHAEPNEKSKQQTASTSGVNTQRKIVKEGTITFETSNIHTTNQTLKQLVGQMNGYVAQEKTYTDEYQLTQHLLVRIPSKSFDHFLHSLSKKYSNLDEKNIRVKDVTEEYIDLEARIGTKKTLKERYLSLLQKANSVNEILAIEKEIAQLQEEIDVFDGKMNYLKDQISWSTLEINYYQDLPKHHQSSGTTFSEAITNGWNGFVLFLVAVVHAWVFILIALVLVYYFLRIRKRKRNS